LPSVAREIDSGGQKSGQDSESCCRIQTALNLAASEAIGERIRLPKSSRIG